MLAHPLVRVERVPEVISRLMALNESNVDAAEFFMENGRVVELKQTLVAIEAATIAINELMRIARNDTVWVN